MNIYLSHNNIISALGFDSTTVVDQIQKENSGLRLIENKGLLAEPFYSSLVDRNLLEEEINTLEVKDAYTDLEKMMILSLSKVMRESGIALTERTGLIVSTTKGNIDVLESGSTFPKDRAYLASLGKVIKDHFGFSQEAIIVSNACVSGVLAVAIAKRYIRQGTFDNVFIVSGDIVTEFILSGFNSFQALSAAPCKPYCKNRTGINIGEVAASALVTNVAENLAKEAVIIEGDGSCNDANHISGPSRTGEGLYRSIQSAMKEAGVQSDDIDYLSAHGTATPYNDEMEAIAFNRSGLQEVPVNSLKGYFGHTLGASGLLETIVGMHSLHRNTLFTSLGYEVSGVSQPITVIEKTEPRKLNRFLKTASGFGGCNTAVIFRKIDKE